MENTARVVGLVPVGRLISKIVADKASLIRLEKNRIDMYKRRKTRLHPGFHIVFPARRRTCWFSWLSIEGSAELRESRSWVTQSTSTSRHTAEIPDFLFRSNFGVERNRCSTPEKEIMDSHRSKVMASLELKKNCTHVFIRNEECVYCSQNNWKKYKSLCEEQDCLRAARFNDYKLERAYKLEILGIQKHSFKPYTACLRKRPWAKYKLIIWMDWHLTTV